MSVDADTAARLERLAELEAQTSSLRHDIRGMLSPALLVADRLLMHSDPTVKRCGESIVKAVKRVEERLVATKKG